MSALDQLNETLAMIRAVGRESVLESAFAELNSTLVSLLERIEDATPQAMKASCDELRGALQNIRIESPVTVNVPQQAPPQVHVHVPEQAAPTVNLQSWNAIEMTKSTGKMGETIYRVVKTA